MWLDLPFVHVSRSVEQNVHTNFSFLNPLLESEELHSWGCSKILLSFLTKLATATTFTSVRVDFGRPPLSSSSTRLLPSQNREYRLKHLIGSEPHSRKPFAPILVFLSQIDRLWNKILWQLSFHFRQTWRIKKTDFTRLVITRKLSKMNKWNSVCERMLVDSTKLVLKLMDCTVYFPLLLHGMHSFPHSFFSAFRHALTAIYPINTLHHTPLPNFRCLLGIAKSDY